MANESDLDVANVARLARLNLSDEETRLFQSQLGQVLEHVAKLREIDVSNVEVTAHAIPVFNVFREDEPRDWFKAPQKANGLLSSPKSWNECGSCHVIARSSRASPEPESAIPLAGHPERRRTSHVDNGFVFIV